MTAQPIWLASYPRSGNTLLRTVLFHCFGLPSASVYPSDLGGNKALEAHVGHIEQDGQGGVTFPPGALPLIKTHELAHDQRKAIYVVRDGRPACVSLWEFYGRSQPLESVIAGQHRFGTWANHVAHWQPRARPGTLLVRYEDIVGDLDPVLEAIGGFLNVRVVSRTIPSRETLARIEGRWVRQKTDWRDHLDGQLLDLFYRINGSTMTAMGYDDAA